MDRPIFTWRERLAIAATSTLIALLVLAGLVLLALSVGCSTAPAPDTTPDPPLPRPLQANVSVRDEAGQPIDGASGALVVDDVAGRGPVRVTAHGWRQSYTLDTGRVQPGWGATLTITAEGYLPHASRVLVPDGYGELPEVTLLREPTLPRLAFSRYPLTEDGSPFVWQGLTAFRLLEFVASGQVERADAYLARAHADGVTVVRVLSMAWHLFRLEPSNGVAALPTLLDRARRHHVYVEVVALADTAAYPGLDLMAHVRAIGAACAAVTNCVVEIANEAYPVHPTQRPELGDVALLTQLRREIPASVPVSLGSTHGAADESDVLQGGDYLTIHGDRADGEGGWRWVRHSNEQRALADRVRRFAVNDEPKRDDLAADRQIGIALLCRLFNIGDTFHYSGGLQGEYPAGAEAVAFNARRRGWAAIPTTWRGQYANAGFTTSPVKGFSGAVRVYSSVFVNEAYTLVLGAEPGLVIEWRDDWPHRARVLVEGGTQLWRVTR